MPTLMFSINFKTSLDVEDENYPSSQTKGPNFKILYIYFRKNL
uniref:Uncharacterized protein n=1 Tax=Lepeophtheirus salmonis TaxID=72036 RepID=A0A0K2UPP8_LEPSM